MTTTRRRLQHAFDLVQAGRAADARSLIEGMLQQMPDNLQARWLLVQCLEQLDDTKAARRQLQTLLEYAGSRLDAINRAAAHLLRRSWPLEPALRAFEAFLASEPTAPSATFNYAWYLARDTQFEAAIEMYQRALQLGVDAPEEAHLNIANIYIDHLNDEERAEAHLKKALALNPDYFGAHYNLGNLAEARGDREGAVRCFEKCLKIEPGNHSALARLGDSRRFTQVDDPVLTRMAETARTSRNSDLHFALGRAHDQLAEYELAWRHFRTANDIDRANQPPYDASKVESRFDRIIEQVDGSRIRLASGACSRPVFICGLFRTGSTLLEQILGAHPGFCPGGESVFFPHLVASELPDYPDGLDAIGADDLAGWRQRHAAMELKQTGGTARLTDKRPDNFLYVGLIKAILPGAKFVVTERDWRDTAVSIFATRLGPSQNYATTLKDIRHYIQQQARLVSHWESVLGRDLVRIGYEDLVMDPRQTLGGLLNALGEEWDERCLSFNSLANAVKTASSWQVREPLNPNSIGRWRNYQRPFEQAFGPSVWD